MNKLKNILLAITLTASAISSNAQILYSVPTPVYGGVATGTWADSSDSTLKGTYSLSSNAVLPNLFSNASGVTVQASQSGAWSSPITFSVTFSVDDPLHTSIESFAVSQLLGSEPNRKITSAAGLTGGVFSGSGSVNASGVFTSPNANPWSYTQTSLGSSVNRSYVYEDGNGSELLAFSISVAPVPEPSSALLLGLGGISFLIRRRR